jgi:peroxiredoxin
VFDRDIALELHVTEDDEGGWTRTFAPARVPAVFLINGRREFVWKYEGEPSPPELAAAMDRLLIAAPAPRTRPLRLAVAVGERAPDATFGDDDAQFAIHRYRGRQVVLHFLRLPSAACVEELRRLQTQYGRADKDSPVIVALYGGAKDSLDRIRKELGLPFPLVYDVQQRVARLYGVRCWPTTVTIDRAGHVERIQFGVTHDHGDDQAGPEQAV